MILQDLLEGRVAGKVPCFMWVLLQVVEFFPWSRPEKDLINKRGQGACLMSFPEKDSVVPVVPILGLQKGAVCKEVTNVAITICANAPDVIYGIVAAVAGGDYVLARLEFVPEEIDPVKIPGDVDCRQGQACGCNIEGGG